MGISEKFYEKRREILDTDSDNWYVECPVTKVIKEPEKPAPKDIPVIPSDEDKPLIDNLPVPTDDIPDEETDKKSLYFWGIIAAAIIVGVIIILNNYL